MMAVFPLLLILAVAGIEGGKHDIYKGHKVYSITLQNRADSLLLGQLETDLNLDIIQYGMPESKSRVSLVRTMPENEEATLKELNNHGVQYKVYWDDLTKKLEEFDRDLLTYRSTRRNRELFEDYPRYAEVDAYMEKLAAEYPDIVRVVTAGNSFEGRPIKYLKISTTNFTDTSKPIFFMEAMLHAREWVTTPVALYSMHRLVEDLRSEDRDLLEGTDWIILPLVNPDGYEYSHDTERFWRKTRSVRPEISETCVGVDGNRNFDMEFNLAGASSNPCAETYPGPSAFSEPETGYVRDILMEHLDRTQVFFDMHSYGNYILFAFGNGTLAPNAVAVFHVAAIMGAHMDAMKLPEADWYKIGNSGNLFYPTSGTADDYAQHVGVPMSYCLELPGYGFGFNVPPSYISHFIEETWRGIAAGARAAKLHYRGPYLN